MALGKVLGEFVVKAMSVRQTDLGGDRRRIEISLAGESAGDFPGQNIGTMEVEMAGDTTRPMPWMYTGVLLEKSGVVIQVSSTGVGIRTGEGHKAHYRGVGRYQTDDAKLAPLNHMIVALEIEADPLNMTMKGTSYEWN
jgi:hypothetical protein